MTTITKIKEKVEFKDNIVGFGRFADTTILVAEVTESFGYFELSDLWTEIRRQKERSDEHNYYGGFVLKLSEEIKPFSIGVLKTFYYLSQRAIKRKKVAIVSDTEMFETFIDGLNNFNKYVKSNQFTAKYFRYYSVSELEEAQKWLLHGDDNKRI